MTTATKNPGKNSFAGKIEGHGSGTWISFPYDLKDLYGIGNLVPVVVTFDGIIYQGSIAKMGGPLPMLLIRKDIFAKLGKQPGEKVEVTVTLDTKPREVKLPSEPAKALKSEPKAKLIYDQLAFSHRREYAEWVGSAKQAETRDRRAKLAIQQIIEKNKAKKSKPNV